MERYRVLALGIGVIWYDSLKRVVRREEIYWIMCDLYKRVIMRNHLSSLEKALRGLTFI
jgi:hypothetical protein